jgi:predicted NBD/HSP70 family sugar kinase
MRKVADNWLRQILLLLYQKKIVTRVQMIEQLGLNHASVSLAVRRLLERGVALKLGDEASSVGRRRELFSLNPEAAYFVAVDLESQRIRFGLSNLAGDIRFHQEEELCWGERLDLRIVFRGLARLLGNLTPRQRARVLAIGICYPGMLDAKGRLTAFNLGLREYPFLAEFRKMAAQQRMADLPVFLEPDKRCSVLAERLAGRGLDDGLLLLVERGIGAAVVAGGVLVEGRHGVAGEIGHVTVEPDAADLCACGKRGCLEAIASSPNIVRQYLEATGGKGGGALRAAHVFDRARGGDEAARAILMRAARALGTAISYAVALLNPAIVVLAGDVVAGEDLLLPWIQAEIKRRVLPQFGVSTEVVCSRLGSDIRLIGAASLALRDSLADAALLERLCAPGALAAVEPAAPRARARRQAAE